MVLGWLIFSEKLQELPSFARIAQKLQKLQELPSGWGLRSQAPIAANCYLDNQQLSKSLLQGF